ncbi:MAG TPA: DUF4922 domain-containing protein [Syntrophales bacterium]|nr:DUF4922 domain-containing protein [Syntrophales bacterium]
MWFEEVKDILFADYEGKGEAGALSRICEALLEQQKGSWRELAEAYEGLSGTEQRTLDCGRFAVVLQFNPRRAASSGAKVDPESIRRRRCFLCTGNLPPLQRGVLYRREFLILCNPAPIFRRHFTVSSLRHRPQSIAGSFGTMQALAEDLGPQYLVFYNGPRCGASAPDHLHFQAVPAGCLPVEEELGKSGKGQPGFEIVPGDGLSVYRPEGLGREAIILEGSDTARITSALDGMLCAMREITPPGVEEPMLNIICTRQKTIRVIIFPRNKHRPDVFYREGEGRKLISPAALDMGGLMIFPIKRDYDSMTCDDILQVYGEVSTGKESMSRIFELLTGFQY